MPKMHTIRLVSIMMIFLILMTDIAVVYANEDKNEYPATGKQASPSKSIHPENSSRTNHPEFGHKSVTPQSSSKSPFRVGDGIMVDAFPDTTSVLNGYFPIDGEGMIDLPMVGKLKITDLSKTELEDFLKSQYKNYLRYPTIRVKPVIRVSVLGGVQNPGFFYVDQNSTLWDVMKLTGSTNYEDGLKDMTWERSGDKISSDLLPYFERGISLKNMGFRSGDQFYTPVIDETFWTIFSQNVLPLLTFATTFLFFYYQYQRDLLYIESGRLR